MLAGGGDVVGGLEHARQQYPAEEVAPEIAGAGGEVAVIDREDLGFRDEHE